jgi:hypothetical protein
LQRTVDNPNNQGEKTLSPRERKNEIFSARIRPEIDQIIKEESAALGLSKTEYVERVIEGTLPSRLEKMFREIGEKHTAEIVAAIKGSVAKSEPAKPILPKREPTKGPVTWGTEPEKTPWESLPKPGDKK